MDVYRVAVSWTYVASLWLIFTPFIIYCCYRLYQYRHHHSVANRGWKASLATEIAVLGIIAINRPLTAFIFLLELKWTSNVIAFIFSSITWAMCFYFIVYGLFVKAYFLFFQIKFSLTLEKKQWKAIINKTDWSNSWYLRHIHTFGNERWVFIRVLVVYLIVCTAHVVIFVITRSNIISQGFLLFISIPVLTMCIVITCITSAADDVLFLRFELKCITILTVIAVIATVATVFINYMVGQWYTDLMSDTVGAWYCLFYTIIQTHLVLSKCELLGKQPIEVSLTEHMQTKLEINFRKAFRTTSDEQVSAGMMDTGSPSTNTHRSPSSENPRNIMQRYWKTMNHEAQFQLFASHCVTEWNIENLAAFIEYAQLFRAMLLHRPSTLQMSLGLLNEYKFEHVEELPKSDIVFDGDTYSKLSSKIIALYNKYISSSCNLELNLSYQVRTKWSEAIASITNPSSIASLGRRMSAQIQRRFSSQPQRASIVQKTRLEPPSPMELINDCSADNDTPTGGDEEEMKKDTGFPCTLPSVENAMHKINKMVDQRVSKLNDIVVQKLTRNEFMLLQLDGMNAQNTIDPLKNVEIDVDLYVFIPLVQRILEQCHLLLMDSYSRFKPERHRTITFDIHDQKVVQRETASQEP